MDSSQKLYDLLRELLEQLPSLLVMSACMIAAVIRWKRHPKASGLVLLSLGWLIGTAFLFAVIYNWVPDFLIHSAGPANIEVATRNTYFVLALISNVSGAVALTVLLAAIFTERSLKKKDL